MKLIYSSLGFEKSSVSYVIRLQKGKVLLLLLHSLSLVLCRIRIFYMLPNHMFNCDFINVIVHIPNVLVSLPTSGLRSSKHKIKNVNVQELHREKNLHFIQSLHKKKAILHRLLLFISMETTTDTKSTIEEIDRANSQLQNMIFQRSHHH